MVFFSKLALVAATACLVAAHPGEKHDHAQVKREIVQRNQMASAAKRSIDSCSSNVDARAVHARSIERRSKALADMRQKRGIKTKAQKWSRDLATLQEFETIDKNETGVYDFTSSTDAATVFSANTSCILSPEVTDGPYYVTGESIRSNVTEGEPGIPLYLEVQYLDINTCLPVEDLYIDIWNCNATGLYSGAVATGNEVGLDSTFLRGVQATDEEGVVAFDTIFPGHYDGRAVHTHLLVHSNVTLMDNGTFQDGSVTHIGQLFWNDELREAVEATYPYTTNTQALTTNDEDMWSIVQAGTTFDPFPQYIYLGDSIEDGLMAWIQIGINATADYSDSDYYQVSAVLQADGGHATSSSSTGGAPSGGEGGNGTMPSGAAPSGAGGAPSSSSAASSSTAVADAAASSAASCSS